jgi:hypothetical protein
LGAQPRKTADTFDAARGFYPTLKLTAADVKMLEAEGEPGRKALAMLAAKTGVHPDHREVTPVRFHPAELPDPAGAYAHSMYPQVIPEFQIDETHETHDLSQAVPVNSPLRAKNRRPR